MNADRFGSVHSTDICNDLVQHVQYSFSMLSGLFGTCQRRYWLPRCWHPPGRFFDGLGPSLAMAGSQCKATRGARCTHGEGTDPRPEEERWRGDSLCLYIHHHRSTWSLLMRFRYFLFLIWGLILEFCANCLLEVPIASGLIRKGNREQALRIWHSLLPIPNFFLIGRCFPKFVLVKAWGLSTNGVCALIGVILRFKALLNSHGSTLSHLLNGSCFLAFSMRPMLVSQWFKGGIFTNAWWRPGSISALNIMMLRKFLLVMQTFQAWDFQVVATLKLPML